MFNQNQYKKKNKFPRSLSVSKNILSIYKAYLQ